jgi:hypothetical protein
MSLIPNSTQIRSVGSELIPAAGRDVAFHDLTRKQLRTALQISRCIAQESRSFPRTLMLTDVVPDAHAKGYLINVTYAEQMLMSFVSLNKTFSLFYLLMKCDDTV